MFTYIFLPLYSVCVKKTYVQLFFLSVEPVCAVGQGVSALCCATEGQRWIFNGYSLTGVSLSHVHIKAIYTDVDLCSIN